MKYRVVFTTVEEYVVEADSPSEAETLALESADDSDVKSTDTAVFEVTE